MQIKPSASSSRLPMRLRRPAMGQQRAGIPSLPSSLALLWGQLWQQLLLQLQAASCGSGAGKGSIPY